MSTQLQGPELEVRPNTLASLMAAGDMPAATLLTPETARATAASSQPATRTPTLVHGSHSSRIKRLSIVVPARNESLNMAGLLDELNEVLNELELPFHEVIVVNDGSTDDTAQLANDRDAKVVTHAVGLGNGAAVKRGIREAKGDWILLLDGDGQHPPHELPAMIREAELHDMVVASRGGSGGSIHRNIANQVYNRFASYVSGRKIPDLTSGYRLMRADVAKSLVWLLPNTFSYPTTITMSMLRGGWSVGFHPFQVRPRLGKSHVRLFADGSRFFVIILRIATMFAPLRVFMPAAMLTGGIGVAWYINTWMTDGRFTNMALLLLTQAMLLFALGLIAEQIAALRFQGLAQAGTPGAVRDESTSRDDRESGDE
ncbi:MAG: glycosyltransferase involved in cell wall biosynthesis [Planctomycetota bacterium]|jgi:glycosyltransferase involved in cell wall biosynthesis